MKKAIVTAVAVAAAVAWAQNQTCIITSPSAPPTPTLLAITLPVDGGTTGCTGIAYAHGFEKNAKSFAVGNAKCAVAVGMAQQAAANDNGWNDGGVP